MRTMPRRSPWLIWTLAAALALPQGLPVTAQTKPAYGRGVPPPGTNADTGWPRNVTLKSGTVVWYQPQVESWTGARHHQDRRGRPTSRSTIASSRMDLKITEYNFKTLSPDQVKTLVADVQALPQNERVHRPRSIARLCRQQPLQVKNVEGIKADPPKVFWATAPAMLINLDGEPIWSPIKDVDLRYAVNTNWDLFEHTPSKTFYLRYNESWLQATAVTGRGRPCRQAARQLLEAASRRQLEGREGRRAGEEALRQGRAEGLRQRPSPPS